MRAYYNEHDPKKSTWLRELIADGQITQGDVDERSIEHVRPGDLRGYTRCHFFAGIGVWDYALDLAGWGDHPVWTGSCPCPSFSCAGQGQGFDDPRHLWPTWFGLIRKCRPPVIFGEQSDDAIGYGWLDLVQSDLEGETYALGKAVLGACSVGAPHIRQRLFFVADAECGRCDGRTKNTGCEAGAKSRNGCRCATCRVANAKGDGWRGWPHEQDGRRREFSLGHTGAAGILGDTDSQRCNGVQVHLQPRESRCSDSQVAGAGRTGILECEWIPCKDGKLRPVEPVPPALADGTANLLGSVRYQGGRIFHRSKSKRQRGASGSTDMETQS